jgi:hypothetical protein
MSYEFEFVRRRRLIGAEQTVSDCMEVLSVLYLLSYEFNTVSNE